MSSIYDLYETNDKMEREGIDLQIGEAKFRVARAGGANSAFRRRVEALTRPYRRQIQSGNMDAKVLEDLSMTAMVETVLLGWKGVKGRDGKEIKFSKDAALKLFKDLPDLYLDIVDGASTYANFRQTLLEEDSKN